MTLGNMRQNGVRGLDVTYSACGHHTEVNVDAWPDDAELTGKPHSRLGREASLVGRPDFKFEIGWHVLLCGVQKCPHFQHFCTLALDDRIVLLCLIMLNWVVNWVEQSRRVTPVGS
jgi:hypothetical protein